MGIFRKLALLGAFALLISNAAAMAADMPEAPVLSGPPMAGPVEFGSGRYLRGDLGYKLYRAPDAHFDYFTGFPPPSNVMTNPSLSNTVVAGLGFGYKFNPWFRADLTLDHEWPGHFHGNLPCVLCTPTFSDEYADISAWSGLVNVYFDLPLGGEGALSGFTPYVGAGVGLSYLTASNVHYLNPPATTGVWPGASTWNFSWALMAGVSYNLTQKWVVDANYRYVHLGNAVSGPTDPAFGNQPIHYDNISASEFRVGLRYLIN